MNVRDITLGILRSEGDKYTNDPADPGGPTKDGVTLATMRGLGLDLNHDGTINALDVQLMTPDLAAQIFEKNYFVGPKINMLPDSLQANVYDMNVNAGSQSVKLLQEIVSYRIDAPLTIDGAIGPHTLGATFRAVAMDSYPGELNDVYVHARLKFYYGLVARNPAMRKYAITPNGQLGGWIIRAQQFFSPNATHISPIENRYYLDNPGQFV
jgi:lysozyme family protein